MYRSLGPGNKQLVCLSYCWGQTKRVHVFFANPAGPPLEDIARSATAHRKQNRLAWNIGII